MSRTLQVRHKGTGEVFALKCMEVRRIDPDLLDDLRNEIGLLRQLDHPNVIRLMEYYEDDNNLVRRRTLPASLRRPPHLTPHSPLCHFLARVVALPSSPRSTSSWSCARVVSSSTAFTCRRDRGTRRTRQVRRGAPKGARAAPLALIQSHTVVVCPRTAPPRHSSSRLQDVCRHWVLPLHGHLGAMCSANSLRC